MKLSIKNKTISFLLLVPVLACSSLQAQPAKTEKPKKKNWIIEFFYPDKTKKHKADALEDKAPLYDNLSCKINLFKLWKFSIGDNDQWISPSFDDRHWEEIKVPSKWENEGFHGYDGYAWYRIHFDGNQLLENQTHFLLPGVIDDADETYLNGQLIGKSGQFPPRHRSAFTWNRKYQIPREIINYDGDNVISIRVYDHYGAGGIIGGKPGIYSSFMQENLLQDLYGRWKFKIRDHKTAHQIDFDDSMWNEILVPSRWDNYGHRSYNGIAWYRKHFKLSFIPDRKKNYYLLLGRIDDFDVTYLNGQKIGVTSNKAGPNGTSKAWQVLRVYKIPPGLLRKDQSNVIAVQVTDVSGPAGIYSGPIGIIEEEHLTKAIRK